VYKAKEINKTTGWSKKRHKVYDTIILKPYVIVMWFSAKCSKKNICIWIQQ